jgi:hypothetical protein
LDTTQWFIKRELSELTKTTLIKSNIELLLLLHPDRAYVSRVLESVDQKGADIGFKGEWTPRIGRRLTSQQD